MNDTTTDNPRRRLYEVMNDETPVDEKQERALAIGCEYLDVENGHVERIEGEEHTVVASVGGPPDLLPEGTVLDRATTYCRRTVEQDSPLALSDAPNQGWAEDPAYEEHGFDCYLGATVYVDGEPFGTVCFVSRDARPEEFTPEEYAFVELLARTLGHEHESRRRVEEIAAEERARERSEAKFEALLNAAPDAIFVADAETGEIADVNDAATDLVGYCREELVGMEVVEVHPSEKREQYRELAERFREGNGETLDRLPDGSPLLVRRRDGTDVPVEMSVAPVELDDGEYLQGIVRDVSDRREREEELRVKNRAFEAASVGITIADARDPDLPLVFANEGFEEVTGYDRASALGRNCRFLQGAKTDDEETDAIRAALDDEEPITTELLNYRADGTPFWNRLTISPVEDATGEVTHFVGVQEDVTGRKRRERLIGVLNRVLRHNLRNDIGVVQGYAEELAERTDGPTARMADEVVDTADGLLALSETARAIEETVRDPGDPGRVDAVSTVETVASRLRETHPEARVEVTGPDQQAVLATDRLEAALYELGENAAVHAGDAPVVEFEVHPPGDDGEWVRVAVRDDGPGLPEQERQVIGSGRETPLDHGSGIGLWLVNWIATAVGGDVSTTVEDGTTVTLRLPVPEPEEGTSPGRHVGRQSAFAPDLP